MDVQDPAPAARGQTGITVALGLAMLLASLGTSIANIALPALVEAFAAPFAPVQGVVVAYLAALTISVVAAGRLGDRAGLKPVLVGGLGLFLGASALCGMAPDLWTLIGMRALQGIGAAVLMTLPLAMMREFAGEARLGRAMGLLGTASALGTALGPSLGGLLLPVTGWRGIFWVLVPLAAIALVLALAVLPASPRAARIPAARAWSMPVRSIAPNLVVNLLVAAVMMATLVVGPFYLGLGLGLGEAMVGLVMATGPVVSIFSGVPAGRLVDACGSDRVLAGGLALLAAGVLLLAILPGMTGVAGYVFAILVLTPGYQLFQAANNTAALADVPGNERGAVSGLLGLSRNIGLIAGASVMGAVFAFGTGTGDFSRATSTAIAAGMRLTFLLATGMMIAALGIALLAPRRAR
ncbi:MAG: MFS transporter [Hyphomicrobiales bacterium]|nr:MFS transporter [Hyphomicrobiales bacterium]